MIGSMCSYDSYQVSLFVDVSDARICDYEKYGQSIYKLKPCDSSQSCISCSDTENLTVSPNLLDSAVLCVSRSKCKFNRLLFNLFVQLPCVRICSLSTVEHNELSELIGTIVSNLNSLNPPVSEAITEACQELLLAFDALSSANTCSTFESELNSTIDTAQVLKDLLVDEENEQYDETIEVIDELIADLNSIVLTLPKQPNNTYYESREFCLTSTVHNTTTQITSFVMNPLDPRTVAISGCGKLYNITRVPSRKVKVNPPENEEDSYTVECVDKCKPTKCKKPYKWYKNCTPTTTAPPLTPVNVVICAKHCIAVSPLLKPKILKLKICLDSKLIQYLRGSCDVKLVTACSTVLPVKLYLENCSNIATIVIDEDKIIDYLKCGTFNTVLSNKIKSCGLFSVLSKFAELCIVSTVKYYTSDSNDSDSDDCDCCECRSRNRCYNKCNVSVSCKQINLLSFSIKSCPYADFCVKLCDGCNVKTEIDEGYTSDVLSSVFSLCYDPCVNVEYEFYVNNLTEIVNVNLDPLTNPDLIEDTDEYDDNYSGQACDNPPCPNLLEDDLYFNFVVDANFLPLSIGVGAYKQAVAIKNIDVTGNPNPHYSYIHIKNLHSDVPKKAWLADINLVVERTVTVSNIVTLLFGIVNPSPTSQQYILTKAELINLGIVLNNNDTYTMTVLYKYVAPLNTIDVTSIQFLQGLQAEVFILVTENNVSSFKPAFDSNSAEISSADNIYYMLTKLNSGTGFESLNKNYYVDANGDTASFGMKFSFNSLLTNQNN